MRLNAWLARSLGTSRRECDALIRAGAVKIAGRTGRFHDRVEPGVEVLLRGRSLTSPASRYLALNKPAGVVTARRDARDRTVFDLLEPAERELFPVGRLDRDSRGLLILTNDGDWANRLLHPSYGARKVYHVILDRDLPIESARAEIALDDGPSRFLEVASADPRRGNGFLVTLVEGRKRQIRRAFRALDRRVIDLVRISVGDINLGRLKEGAWRDLTPREIESVRNNGAKKHK
jgi:23S rRNA pseudouridine2605 synthase